jgi:mRNA interferase MazF
MSLNTDLIQLRSLILSMKEANIVLAQLPQADGILKRRPVVILREMPKYQDFLVCGISTQLHQEVKNFDEIISLKDSDFTSSGLKSDSLIRLGFLNVLVRKDIIGTIVSISPDRHKRLLENLSDYLIKQI